MCASENVPWLTGFGMQKHNLENRDFFFYHIVFHCLTSAVLRFFFYEMQLWMRHWEKRCSGWNSQQLISLLQMEIPSTNTCSLPTLCRTSHHSSTCITWATIQHSLSRCLQVQILILIRTAVSPWVPHLLLIRWISCEEFGTCCGGSYWERKEMLFSSLCKD